VTDAVAPAECLPGPYKLGVVDVELLAEGRVVLKDGSRLAGSALRMDTAVGNTVRMAGVTLAETLTMASRNPARVARISGRQRGLQPGERADFVVFQWDSAAHKITVEETYVSGKQVFGQSAAAA